MQSWRLPSTQDRPEPLSCWSQAAALPWPPRARPLHPDIQSHPHCLGPVSQHRTRSSPPSPAKATAQRPREQREAGNSETFGKPLASVLVSCQSPGQRGAGSRGGGGCRALGEGKAAGRRRGALDGHPGVTCLHPLVHMPPLLGQDQCTALLRARPPAQVPVATEGLGFGTRNRRAAGAKQRPQPGLPFSAESSRN